MYNSPTKDWRKVVAFISLNVDFSPKSRQVMKALGYEPVPNYAAYESESYQGLLDLYYVQFEEWDTIKKLLDDEKITHL